MRRHFIIGLAATILVGAAAQSLPAEKPKLPKCDGGKRRDANPYGSVLPGAPKPAVTTTQTAGKPVAALTPRPGAAGIARLRTYPSC